MKFADTGDQPLLVQPLYAQVRDRLLSRIVLSEWVVGEPLPNEYKLAHQYGVSIGTVRRAVATLEDHGIVRRVQGRGTYVAGQGPNALPNKFEHLLHPNGQSLIPSFELVSVVRQPATAAAAKVIGLDAGEQVIEVTQLLLHNGETVGVTHSVLSAVSLPRFEEQLRFGQHLYPLLAEYGLLVARTQDTWSVGQTDEEFAKLLGVSTKTLVLNAKRVAFALNNAPVEFRTNAYLSTKVQVAHVLI